MRGTNGSLVYELYLDSSQDTLRAGIDHHDGSGAAAVMLFHSQVNFSTTGWLG